MSRSDVVKAPCPVCNGDRNCDVVAEHSESWEQGPVDGHNYYSILQCKGCDEVFYRTRRFFSENFHQYYDESGETVTEAIPDDDFFPMPRKREEPRWLTYKFALKHPGLNELLKRMNSVFDAGHNLFSAMAVRTCFEQVSISLDINEHLSFSEKIEGLRKNGHISPREKDLLATLTDLGSAAIHRNWTPNDEEMHAMIDALEGFIQRSLVLPENLDQIKQRTPGKKS